MKKFHLLIILPFIVLLSNAQVNISDITTLKTQTADNSTLYCLTGEVLLVHQQSFRNQKVIQDGTAGILIDDPTGIITSTYNIGDGITGICGKLYFYTAGGFLEFIPVVDPGTASSGGNTIVPVELTINEFNNNFDDHSYELVKINGVTFDDAGSTFANGTAYTINDASSNTATFYTYVWNVDYIGTKIPSETKNIVGISMARDLGSTKFIVARDSGDFSTVFPMPLNTSGIFIAIGLVLLFVLIRFKRFIF